MAQTKSWVFTQLTGKRRSFTLTGKYAPYGRPRQRPVVTDGIEARETSVYYDGNNSPTRLIFGSKEIEWELNGRFLDFHFGEAGGARKKATELKQFVADLQPISIRWGDILSCNGFIKQVRFPREGEGDIRYEMTLLIDNDDHLDNAPTFDKPVSTSVLIDNLAHELRALLEQKRPDQPDYLPLKPSFLDAIENDVSAINAPFASLAAIAEQIGSVEKALSADLMRVVFGCQQVKTAVQNLRDRTNTFSDDAILLRSGGDSRVLWAANKTQIDVSSNLILALLADLSRSAEIAFRSQTKSGVQAEDGDTWEAISMRVYGNALGVQKLRDANGIKYGEKPSTGKTYQVPL